MTSAFTGKPTCHLLVCGITALSACGGSNSGPVTVPAEVLLSDATRAVTEGPSGVTITEAVGGATLATANSLQMRGDLPARYVLFEGPISMASMEPTQLALIGASSGGEMRVVSAIGTEDIYSIERIGSTELPGASAGSVTYTGDYVGVYELFPVMGSPEPGVMFGSASLTFDFAGSSFTGSITGRQSDDMTPASNVNIVAGTINADGSFDGFTEGGGFTLMNDTSQGTVSGLFGGANGELAGAGFALTHAPFNGAFGPERGTVILEAP